MDEVESMVERASIVEIGFSRVTRWELIPDIRDDDPGIVGTDASSSSARIRVEHAARWMSTIVRS
jgi:hypothetical protein